MTISSRNYLHENDYRLVSRFLIEHHQPGNADGNWLEPMWEYMHSHPMLDAAQLDRFGLWEADGQLVAVCHYETSPGEAFFQVHPAHSHLQADLLAYAEQHLARESNQDGRRSLRVYVREQDEAFLSLVASRGYRPDPGETRPLYRYDLPDPFPAIDLPQGFRLGSLAEDCDWARVHQVLWRGFDHGNQVPMEPAELESRRAMFETPSARPELKIVVVAPNGDFASLCGMFFQPEGRYAYVEPVATDPRYRRLGLGRAAVLEGIRRCMSLGALTAYVASDQQFYQSFGFRKCFDNLCWVKSWDA